MHVKGAGPMILHSVESYQRILDEVKEEATCLWDAASRIKIALTKLPEEAKNQIRNR
jgi:hypothetical protein